MSKGSIVVPDDAHTFGLLQFPNLPLVFKNQIESGLLGPEDDSESSTQVSIEIESKQNFEEQIQLIKEKIENLIFPELSSGR
jgi:hypothetical protein